MSALDLLHLATTAAERAAAYLLSVRRPADPARWTLKGSRDFVTEVDRTAAQMIREILLGRNRRLALSARSGAPRS